MSPAQDPYQIDYFLIEERYRNAIENANGLPGADINSDHIPTNMEIQLTLKRLEKAKVVKKWSL